MRLTTVFNKLLCLQAALVCAVRFEKASIIVTVRARSRLHRCPFPGCSFATRSGYDTSIRTWRHVSLGAWPVYVEFLSTRLRCPVHGILHEMVGWAAPGSRFTSDFEEIVAWLAKEMSFTAITRLMRIAWSSVASIVQRVVGRNLDGKRLDDLFVIGVDEISYRKGHKYITVVANHLSGKVVEMAEGRSGESLGKFFDALGPQRTAKLKAVSMDMSKAFVGEVSKRAPQAQIVFDPFHVVQLANEALQEVRRNEAREAKGTAGAKFLKGTRWALLKAPEDLSLAEKLRLALVAQVNAPVYRAYLLKEELRALYACGPGAAKSHLDAWLSWASHSKLTSFAKLARTLRQYRQGILAAIQLRLSNGRLEGLNNKIRMLQHRAFGFHSAAALVAMVFLTCGNVPVSLPQLPISN